MNQLKPLSIGIYCCFVAVATAQRPLDPSLYAFTNRKAFDQLGLILMKDLPGWSVEHSKIQKLILGGEDRKAYEGAQKLYAKSMTNLASARLLFEAARFDPNSFQNTYSRLIPSVNPGVRKKPPLAQEIAQLQLSIACEIGFADSAARAFGYKANPSVRFNDAGYRTEIEEYVPNPYKAGNYEGVILALQRPIVADHVHLLRRVLPKYKRAIGNRREFQYLEVVAYLMPAPKWVTSDGAVYEKELPIEYAKADKIVDALYRRYPTWPPAMKQKANQLIRAKKAGWKPLWEAYLKSPNALPHEAEVYERLKRGT